MIDQLVTAIVRPPRREYTTSEFESASTFVLVNTSYERSDFNVTNPRGHMLQASLWSDKSSQSLNSDCCLIYMHPNSGNRMDIIRSKALQFAMAIGLAGCSFDFSACGSSEGDYISLGVREKDDAALVISYLIGRGYKRFILWGRSMGAATSCLFLGAFGPIISKMIVAVILDSPFNSFRGLVKEQAKNRHIPSVFRYPALQYLRRSVRKKCDFDLLHIDPLAAAQLINFRQLPEQLRLVGTGAPSSSGSEMIPYFPVLVLSALEDLIVSPAMSAEIYDAITMPKVRIVFPGGHNSPRPPEIFRAIAMLIKGALEVNSISLINGVGQTQQYASVQSDICQSSSHAKSQLMKSVLETIVDAFVKFHRDKESLLANIAVSSADPADLIESGANLALFASESIMKSVDSKNAVTSYSWRLPDGQLEIFSICPSLHPILINPSEVRLADVTRQGTSSCRGGSSCSAGSGKSIWFWSRSSSKYCVDNKFVFKACPANEIAWSTLLENVQNNT